MALFCDFENIALGVREAKYPQFDIRRVLERLLVKGNIVVRKAYCDWDRYKEFKAPMHGHVDAFVVISGDSDFSPLVAKLRENNKLVIGIGVKKSTSDLLTAACDEFIYYDDLVREEAHKTHKSRKVAKAAGKEGAPPKPSEQEADDKKHEAMELVVETAEALQTERGEGEPVWASMVKQAIKRRKPGFNESYYGFRSFSALLEEAARTGLIKLERDQRSGGYIILFED